MTDEKRTTEDRARSLIAEIFHDRARTAPSVLYHYTDASALLSMLKTNRFWATNSNYSNDSSERLYGELIVDERLSREGERRLPVDVYHEFDRRRGRAFDHFITCFCQNGDLLNQWRVYAGPRLGYAIGFRASELSHDASTIAGGVLIPVKYSREEQLRWVQGVLEFSQEREKELEGRASSQSTVVRLRAVLERKLATLALATLGIKHPAFEVEHEWRLVHVARRTESHVLHRAGKYGILPYVEIAPRLVDGQRLPIESVTLGPTPEPELAMEALEGALHQSGYRGVKVEKSQLPIRW